MEANFNGKDCKTNAHPPKIGEATNFSSNEKKMAITRSIPRNIPLEVAKHYKKNESETIIKRNKIDGHHRWTQPKISAADFT